MSWSRSVQEVETFDRHSELAEQLLLQEAVAVIIRTSGREEAETRGGGGPVGSERLIVRGMNGFDPIETEAPQLAGIALRERNAGMCEHRLPPRPMNQADDRSRRDRGLADIRRGTIPQEAFERLTHARHVSGLEKRARHVGPADGTTGRDRQHAAPRHRRAELVEPLHHGLRSLDPGIAIFGEVPPERLVPRIEPISEDVGVPPVHIGTELDTSDEPDAVPLGSDGTDPESADRIVIRDGNSRQAAQGGLFDQSRRRETTVGECRVCVQIGECHEQRKWAAKHTADRSWFLRSTAQAYSRNVPDNHRSRRMDRIWSPWRTVHVTDFERTHRPEGDGTVFRRIAEDSARDDEHFVVWRGDIVYVVMNLYPYNNGHLLIVPNREVEEYVDLTEAEQTEIARTIGRACRWLQTALQPEGFNVGINIGKAAGAGIPQHLHVHVVPRWSGDTNFLPAVGGAKLIPEAMEDTFRKLRAAVESESEGRESLSGSPQPA
jgi:ATP adenylyltransferase